MHEPSSDVLLASGALLCERGVFGLVWLDDDLIVSARYGKLADFIVIGQHIAETLLPLYGLDDQIRSLVDDDVRVFEVPDVSIKLPDAPQVRLNITIHWSAALRRLLVLLARASAGSDMEVHLAQQMRARLMAEADATALAKQLARANHDLEEFASIISHDLQAPMRAMRYLTDDAEAALAAGQKQVAAEKIARVREQSRRLSTMLTAVFDYARAGTKQDVIARVDLRTLAETIIRSLPRRDRLQIEFLGEWPVIDTLAAPLDLVVRNLIENAIKHHDRDEVNIQVRAAQHHDLLEITVSDDGPGIAPRHHDAIFHPFRRLTTIEGPAGGGMGLALVKRTVNSVGGQLAVVSDPQTRRGATFRVLWPMCIKA